ncbi:hypothetical protein N7326_00530 [Corynebacterium sp. ES2794-CONJ1]|uniref:hypothetical protein n=1 Tax=unclassified Corynebacterium TaxID=2624378 RepID=UPI0021690964|nr:MULTISPECIES: hypothetical protein [unclassified Corynebacterium]MCS4491128.1 hypothetical protein [Corynebacterium sp. ES2715-CONJ3]MCS4530991.1 hypothetical protein [Corynebacterium sp. ES2730-CONJ]MCU9518358.1 hypothetical protein [Corynebacterium sp. ES2794-CONJ1]
MKDFYSPLQNITLWLGAWFYGFESFDSLKDALGDLGGAHSLYDGEENLLELLKFLRQKMLTSAKPPVLMALLGGPGDPIPAPLGVNEALLIGHHTLLIPHQRATGVEWEAAPYQGRPLSTISLGEADTLLREATARSADYIEGRDSLLQHQSSQPRLLVGTLSDFYENPGLPADLPPRAGQLIARADRVSAIVEAVHIRYDHHAFDPQLLSLAKYIRHARMAAISYSLVEWGRRAGGQH